MILKFCKYFHLLFIFLTLQVIFVSSSKSLSFNNDFNVKSFQYDGNIKKIKENLKFNVGVNFITNGQNFKEHKNFFEMKNGNSRINRKTQESKSLCDWKSCECYDINSVITVNCIFHDKEVILSNNF